MCQLQTTQFLCMTSFNWLQFTNVVGSNATDLCVIFIDWSCDWYSLVTVKFRSSDCFRKVSSSAACADFKLCSSCICSVSSDWSLQAWLAVRRVISFLAVDQRGNCGDHDNSLWEKEIWHLQYDSCGCDGGGREHVNSEPYDARWTAWTPTDYVQSAEVSCSMPPCCYYNI